MTRPLRIGVDARELLGSATGAGRYLGELLRRWVVRPDAATRRFLVYSPQPLTMAFAAGTVEPRVLGGGTGTVWEQGRLALAVARDRPDVFFAPAYTAPMLPAAPLAVAIHDVSFAAHPEWFRPREGARRRIVTRRAVRQAGVVLTLSEFSRSEITRLFGADPARVEVVTIGAGLDQPRPRAEVTRDPLVLYVGSIFNRRRLPQLVRIFADATRDLPAARLAVVGANRTWPPQDIRAEAARHGIAARVDVHDFVDDDALADLYARATVFAFLSEYEGLGLTPLEALSAGVPPLVLDTAVAREAYGDAAVFVAPNAPDDGAGALRDLLSNSDRRTAVLAHAPAVLARYSWDDAATRTLAAIERLARR